MRTAAMKPEVALLDNDDLETIESDVDWHFVTLGEQQNFGIKTAGTLTLKTSQAYQRATLIADNFDEAGTNNIYSGAHFSWISIFFQSRISRKSHTIRVWGDWTLAKCTPFLMNVYIPT